jgi:hypothetical protein
MKNDRLVPLFAAFLVLPGTLSGWAQPQSSQSQSPKLAEAPIPRSGVGMLLVIQEDCPLKLVETTHSIPDLLKSARFENKSARTVVSYRMGWITLFRDSDRKSEVTIGKAMNVPAGIQAGGSATVPAQGLWISSIPGGAKLIGFFVADVEFADGTHYAPDMDRIVSEQEKAERKQ